MGRPVGAVWVVQSLSLTRIAAGVLFACVAFQSIPRPLLVTLYVLAMATDLVDGYLARRLNARTYFGKVVDLVSDKSLTIISLLYAAARGISIAPLAIIATREIVMIGMRLVTLHGGQLFPTSRSFGGVMAFLLWGTTALLIATSDASSVNRLIPTLYWVCAALLGLNLLRRLRASAARIKASVADGQ